MASDVEDLYLRRYGTLPASFAEGSMSALPAPGAPAPASFAPRGVDPDAMKAGAAKMKKLLQPSVDIPDDAGEMDLMDTEDGSTEVA